MCGTRAPNRGWLCGNVTAADLRYYHTQPPRPGPTPSRAPLAHPVRTGALSKGSTFPYLIRYRRGGAVCYK